VAEGGLETLSANEATERIARGELSAEEYAAALLARIEAVEDEIHAFVHRDADAVLAQARALDERRRDGLSLGPLHGVAVAVKDIIDTADFPTECGSPMFAGRRPMADATVVARMRSAGAVVIGKTVTTECAYRHPGPTRNPHDPTRTPGGSSSGSAAAVAVASTPLAIGSQTNGSVIRPASFCGVFGMKPSHGLISRAGCLMLSRHLDHVGVFARSLDDLALLLDVVAGHDPADSDTRAVAAPNFRKVLAEPPPVPPRFAFMRTPVWNKADAATCEAFETLVEHLGEAVGAVELPDRYAAAWDDHHAIMAADMAHRLGGVVDRGGDAASEALRALVAEGQAISASRYLAACDAAPMFNAGLAEVFNFYDAILTPATPGVAPKGLQSTGDPAFCTLWTLVGLPAVSLPILNGEDGMPLGAQLVGPRGDDARLLRSARWLMDRLAGRAPASRSKGR
jgi:Asp-tRNA(Asn)/Glu-tRNA(Gln) amidotransferase A subunit family amidase